MAKSKDQTKATDAKVADNGQATDAEPTPKRGKLLFIAAGSGLGIFCIIVGVVVVLKWKPVETVPQVQAPVDVLQNLVKGEQLQQAGHPDKAMELYRAAAPLAESQLTSLAYRMGVCAQQLGDLESARAYYEQSLSHPSEEIAAAGRLAFAKLLYVEGEFDACMKHLSRMATVAAKPIYASTRLGAEVNYMLALAQAKRVQRSAADPLAKDHVFFAELPFELEEMLSLVPREGNQLQFQGRGEDELEIGVRVQGAATEPSTTLVSANLHNKPISILLDLLVAQTDWDLSASEFAREIVAAKTVSVLADDKTAGELLDLILAGERLYWTFADNQLRIDSRDNAPREELKLRRVARAVRLLQAALADSPDHALAPHSYVALGNLAAEDELFERAATHYRETTERFAQRRAAQVAHFNLAKTFYRKGDFAAAEEAFFRVVDSRRGSQLEPLAYLYVGRMMFDQGRLKQAKTELSRGLALGKVDDYVAATAIALAAAYLMEDDTSAAVAANSVLLDHRQSFVAERFRDEVIFLSALTRFRTAYRKLDVERRARELLSAAVKVDAAGFFGDFGHFLVGDALASINLSGDAVELFQAGLALPLAKATHHHLMFRLAEEYRTQNRPEEAIKLLQDLSVRGASGWAPKAAIELAGLFFQAQEYAKCIAHCEMVLQQDFKDEDKAELLRQLGRVYEEMGEYELAGYCFAGFLPKRSTEVAEVEHDAY